MKTLGRQATGLLKALLEKFSFTGDALKVTGSFTSSQGPTQFNKDTVPTEVSLDTVTPANNDPLPIDLYDVNGQRGTLTNPIVVNPGRFGDTPDVSTVAASTSSVSLVSADTTRKQVIVVNNSNKILWISYVSPAVLGKGYPLDKNAILIEDVYRGAMYGIWESGVTGNAQVTDVTV